MNLKRTALIAVLAAAAAVMLFFLFFRPPSTPAPFQGCPDQSLVYVYATEEQRKAADIIIADLKMMLQYQGINIVNLPVCAVPAPNLPEKFQVYPTILLRGNVSMPGEYISRTVNGYREVYPLIPAMIAQRRGVSLLYSYTGEVLVVQGSAPFTNVSVSTLLHVKDLLSTVFLVNITQVLPNVELASKFNILPGIVVRSSYNLSKGAPYIVELAPGLYTVAERYQISLLQYIGVFAYEIRSNPLAGFEDGVSLGVPGAPTLYLLEDYNCPFCAKFIINTGALLFELAKEGKIRVVFLDLVVHSEVAPLHAFARCLFNFTGNASLYFDLTRDLYRILLSGKTATLDDAVNFAKSRVAQNVVNASLDCSKGLRDEVLAKSSMLQNAGFTGTPTFVFWSDSTGRGLLIEGCMDVYVCIKDEDLLRIIEWLSKG